MSERSSETAGCPIMSWEFHGSKIEAFDGPDGRTFVMDGQTFGTLGLAIVAARQKKDAETVTVTPSAPVTPPPSTPSAPFTPDLPIPPAPTRPAVPPPPAKPVVTDDNSNDSNGTAAG